MKLLVTGGTGFLGRALTARLRAQGHELVLLTRHPYPSPRLADAGAASGSATAGPPPAVVGWDSGWERELSSCDGVINFAGEPIAAGRWTAARKQAIRESRIGTTHRIVQALGAAEPRRPAFLLNASAIGYYGPRGDEPIDETTPAGTGFLADTCRAWEEEAKRARSLGVRVVILRHGLVLGPDGGALAKMLPPFRAFLGGPLGSGRQWVSWIHRDDAAELIAWAAQTEAAAGAVNATAPEPATMRDFCAALGRALHRSSWAPAPAPLLRAALGEMADMLLTGQRVLPQVALRHRFAFRYPRLHEAIGACVA